MNSGTYGSVNGTVGEYNATTGAAINANFITGLDYPYGLALSGNKLLVTNTRSNEVSGGFLLASAQAFGTMSLI